MILENAGDTRAPVLRQVQRFEAPEVLNAAGGPADQGRDQRTPVEPPDRVRQAAEAMVGDVLARLAKGGYEQLVLVAPPQVLGAIRDRMPAAVKALVKAEVPKTLTKHPLPKVAELVAEALATA
jgi:protein required for attachment to host cells